MSVVPVIALVVTPFYGYTDINLTILFYAFGLAMAAIDGPVNRPVAVQPSPDRNGFGLGWMGEIHSGSGHGTHRG